MEGGQIGRSITTSSHFVPVPDWRHCVRHIYSAGGLIATEYLLGRETYRPPRAKLHNPRFAASLFSRLAIRAS